MTTKATPKITATKAKRQVAKALDESGARRGRLSAQTMKSEDPQQDDRITVTVHNWCFSCLPEHKQISVAFDISNEASKQGFLVEFEY